MISKQESKQASKQANKQTPQSRVLHDKLAVPWLVSKFPALYENRQFIKHVHNSLLLVPILSLINPAHILSSYLLEVHSNIVLLPMPRSSKWSLSFRFPHQIPVVFLFSSTCAMYPAHLILLETVAIKDIIS
jgi:hypothetical protein